MYKILLFCLLSSPGLCFTQKTINVTGSNISSRDAQTILDYHNKVRNELGVPSLQWSQKLSLYAQNWADSLANTFACHIIHRKICGENGLQYGENLFMGSSSQFYKPIDAAIAWYNEKQKYSYGKLTESNWYRTGHYTQMIWKETKEVGIGVATCPNGSIIVVANYYPAGNFIGQFPY